MKFFRSLALAAAFIASATLAYAQSAPTNPAMTYGNTPTVGQWVQWFQQKQDTLGYHPINRSGDTLLGPINLFAASATGAGLNMGVGTAPSTPNPGDVWQTASGLFYQSNTSTIGPLGGGSVTSITCLGTTITGSGSCGALTGDVTSPSSTGVTTVAKIQGTTINSVPSSGILVGTTDTQTLTNKSISGSQINSGQVAVANGGTGVASVTAHYIPIGEGTSAFGAVNTSSSACVVQGQGASADPLCNALTGPIAISASGVTSVGNNTITYAMDAQSGANTVSGNTTGSTANRTDVSLPSCSGATAALSYTSGTGFGCNTNLGPVVGYRNRLYNGDQRISQRNGTNSSTSTTTAPGVYGGPDRFYSLSGGAAVSVQQVAGSGAQFAYQVTGVASNTSTEVGQRIESNNIYDLASTTVSFQVGISCSALTSVTWTAYYPGSTDTWTSRTQISTGTFTVTSTMTTYSTTIALPSNVTAGAEIALSTGAMTSGNCKYQNWQLEAGSVATAFERLPMTEEIALCQRYYEKSYDLGIVPGTASSVGGESIIATTGLASAANNTWQAVGFKVTKFGVPTITFYSPATGTSGKIRDGANSVDVNVTLGNQGTSGFNWSATANAANTTVNFQAQWTANSEL